VLSAQGPNVERVDDAVLAFWFCWHCIYGPEFKMRSTVMLLVGCSSILVGCAGPGQNMSTGSVTVAQRLRTQDTRRGQPTYKPLYSFLNYKQAIYTVR
jgi:hypothetical protein